MMSKYDFFPNATNDFPFKHCFFIYRDCLKISWQNFQQYNHAIVFVYCPQIHQVIDTHSLKKKLDLKIASDIPFLS